MGKKRFAVNFVANLFTHIVSILVSFLLTPFLVNHLGKEIYGFYGLANNVVNYITVISVALNSMAAKYITVELVRGNETKAKKYYSSIFFSNVAFTILLAPVLIIIVWNLQSVFVISEGHIGNVKTLFFFVFSAIQRAQARIFSLSVFIFSPRIRSFPLRRGILRTVRI